MEDHIVAAHLAVIIGYVLLVDQVSWYWGYGKHVQDNLFFFYFKSQAEMIKSKLNNHKFIDLIEIMKKFLLFMKIMVIIHKELT